MEAHAREYFVINAIVENFSRICGGFNILCFLGPLVYTFFLNCIYTRYRAKIIYSIPKIIESQHIPSEFTTFFSYSNTLFLFYFFFFHCLFVFDGTTLKFIYLYYKWIKLFSMHYTFWKVSVFDIKLTMVQIYSSSNTHTLRFKKRVASEWRWG